MKKVITAAQAASLVRTDDVVTVSSSSGLGCPDKVLQALGERFDNEGQPRRLTMLHPIAAGDMYGIKGMDHIAKPGLLSRVLAGSYPSGPSSLPMPQIWHMIIDNQVEAYNVPSGILFDMHRDAAARRPGVLTKVGVGTFVDPDQQGCAMNADCAMPTASTGSASSRKRSVSMSCTVMSRITPPPACGLSRRQPCRFGGRYTAWKTRAKSGRPMAPPRISSQILRCVAALRR